MQLNFFLYFKIPNCSGGGIKKFGQKEAIKSKYHSKISKYERVRKKKRGEFHRLGTQVTS